MHKKISKIINFQSSVLKVNILRKAEKLEFNLNLPIHEDCARARTSNTMKPRLWLAYPNIIIVQGIIYKVNLARQSQLHLVISKSNWISNKKGGSIQTTNETAPLALNEGGTLYKT